MKRKTTILVLVSVIGSIVLVGGGWFGYRRYQVDQDTEACFMGTSPDACFRLAVAALRNGQISESDRLLGQYCALQHQTGGEITGCLLTIRQTLVAAAQMK